MIGSHGAGPVIDVKLNADETKALHASAQAIRTVTDAVTANSTTAATTNQ